MTQKSPSFLSTPSFSALRDQSHSNQTIQTEMFADTISNGDKLRELKNAIINELHGKMTGIIRDRIKLQHSNQESVENTSVCRKEIELLKNEMKKKEDLIKTILDTIKELTAANRNHQIKQYQVS